MPARSPQFEAKHDFMNFLKSIRRGLLSPFQRRELKQKIDEEHRFHVEQHIASSMAAAMPREDAEREAATSKAFAKNAAPRAWNR